MSNITSPWITRESFERLTDDQKWGFICVAKEAEMEQSRRLAEVGELEALLGGGRYTPSSVQMRRFVGEMEALCASNPVQPPKDRRPAAVGPRTPVCQVGGAPEAPERLLRLGVQRRLAGLGPVDQIATVSSGFVIERRLRPLYADPDGREPDFLAMANPDVEGIGGSPSFVARAVADKFCRGVPFYRQEEILRAGGLALPRRILARWAMAYGRGLLGLKARFQRWIDSSRLVVEDAARLHYLNIGCAAGRASTDGVVTSRVGCSIDRASRRARRLLLLGGDKRLSMDEVLRRIGGGDVGLLDSFRQGFVFHFRQPVRPASWSRLAGLLETAMRKTPWDSTKSVLEDANRILQVEKELRARYQSGEIGEDAFLDLRRQESLPAIERFCATVRKPGLAGDAALPALVEFCEHEDGLRRYLETLEGDPSNEWGARAVDAFSSSPDRWLFAFGPLIPEVSLFFLSLIETARLNGLEPEDYLEYVLTWGPYAKTESELDALLPWNMDSGKLWERRRLRLAARPDPQRTGAYELWRAFR